MLIMIIDENMFLLNDISLTCLILLPEKDRRFDAGLLSGDGSGSYAYRFNSINGGRV
jgi:hypothetical protein